MADLLSLDEHGAELHKGAALASLDILERLLSTCSPGRAGTRLYGLAGLADLLHAESLIGSVAANHLGENSRPVRAILFDKTPGANWGLGWHQDRTIAVRDREDLPDYGPWSIKAGVPHVEPPFAVIQAMVTLRIHLDDVPKQNAPLLIAPGSHRLGRISEPEIADAVGRCGTAMCLAQRGDVWSYSTPILHASTPSTGHAHRRVLQVDYAAAPLAAPLEWLRV